MTRFLLIILLFFGHSTYSQNKFPTKSQVLKCLTKETKLKKNVYNSTSWFTAHSDSSYKEADTLVFYNNPAYRYGKHFCRFIDWNFYKKDAFWMQRLELCAEPTTGSVAKEQDFYTFELNDKQTPILLKILHKGELVDMFEVLSLTKQPFDFRGNEITEVLTLHRIEVNKPAANTSLLP